MKTLLLTSYLPTSYINFFKPKNLLLITLLLVNFVGFSQNTNIPDENFEQALIHLGYDTGQIDGFVPTANISGITSLNISSRGITDLTGIKAFTSLTSLKCNNNQLTSLDVSANTNLTSLKCRDNNLTSLDVSKNTLLTLLNCRRNNLTSLNIKNGNNSDFIFFKTKNNPNLICIEADDTHSDSTSIWISGADSTSSFSKSCYTKISDSNFEQALIDLSYDSGSIDGVVLTANISVVTSLSLIGENIEDLTGIGDFTALTQLNCSRNQLSALDVSKNTALARLYCQGNELSSLDISTNTALTRLYCDNNSLSILDVSANTALIMLYCNDNILTSLNVSKNTALTTLYSHNNKLTALNVKNGNNNNFSAFRATNNPDLTCIKVDDVEYSTTNWTRIGSTSSFSEDCNTTPIPDANFEQALIDLGYDTNGKNGNILNSDAAKVTSLNVSKRGASDSEKISSLSGIEAFTALTRLYCHSNQLMSLDVSANTALTSLFCYSNQLTSLDISTNTALVTLWCQNNELTSLDISTNTILTGLICERNRLTNLYVSTNTALTSLACSDNRLTDIDVSRNTALTYLVCSGNRLTNIDVSANTTLTTLICGLNQLTSLDVSTNTALTTLACSSNQLTSLNISTNINLTSLNYSYNQLMSLDVSKNTALTRLSCRSNQLTIIDVSTNIALTYLDCHNNSLTSLNVKNGNNTNFRKFNARGNSNLTCIQVDDATYSTTSWTDKDSTASFSKNCNNTTQSSSTVPTTRAKFKQNTIISDVDKNKKDKLLDFYISPNPTKDIIYINNISGNTAYILLNIRGQTLKKGVLTTVNNSIDFSPLVRGIYLLSLKTSKGNFTKKVVRN